MTIEPACCPCCGAAVTEVTHGMSADCEPMMRVVFACGAEAEGLVDTVEAYCGGWLLETVH